MIGIKYIFKTKRQGNQRDIFSFNFYFQNDSFQLSDAEF